MLPKFTIENLNFTGPNSELALLDSPLNRQMVEALTIVIQDSQMDVGLVKAVTHLMGVVCTNLHS